MKFYILKDKVPVHVDRDTWARSFETIDNRRVAFTQIDANVYVSTIFLGIDHDSRPDRSHYVIDMLPDYVTVIDDDTGEKTNVEVIQIWIDPDYPDAHRDPALRRYLNRRDEEGKIALIRFNQSEAISLLRDKNGKWYEHASTVDPGRKYSLENVAAALNQP
jgi:hypothetical protein